MSESVSNSEVETGPKDAATADEAPTDAATADALPTEASTAVAATLDVAVSSSEDVLMIDSAVLDVATTGEAKTDTPTPTAEEDTSAAAEEEVKVKEEQPRLEERTILKLQEAFSLFDHDGDGKLTLHQTATMIRAVGLGLTEKNIAEILAEAPCAKIDFGTFLTSMADHLKAGHQN